MEGPHSPSEPDLALNAEKKNKGVLLHMNIQGTLCSLSVLLPCTDVPRFTMEFKPIVS